jgi:hypothetical protein
MQPRAKAYRLPSICRQGRRLTCTGQLLSGEVEQSDADTYFPEGKAAGCMLLGASDR